MTAIHWHRDKAPDGTPRYYAEMPIGVDPITGRGGLLVRVADAAQTGRPGVDDYPWDWSLTDAGRERAYAMLPARSMTRLRTVGVADTLRSVKENVAYLVRLAS
jgi:hypothetical protein